VIVLIGTHEFLKGIEFIESSVWRIVLCCHGMFIGRVAILMMCNVTSRVDGLKPMKFFGFWILNFFGEHIASALK